MFVFGTCVKGNLFTCKSIFKAKEFTIKIKLIDNETLLLIDIADARHAVVKRVVGRVGDVLSCDEVDVA